MPEEVLVNMAKALDMLFDALAEKEEKNDEGTNDDDGEHDSCE